MPTRDNVFGRSSPMILVQAQSVGRRGPGPLNLTDRVMSFTYEDNERAADKLEMTIRNWDLDNFDDPVWQQGTILEVQWGYPGKMAPLRTVQIRKVKGFTELSIEAHGLEVNLNKEVKCEVFENMTRSQVVQEIAIRAGFDRSDTLHIQDTEVVLSQIMQARKTDSQFLRRLARKENFEWYIDFDGFHFHERNVLQRPIRVFTWYRQSSTSEGDIISINIDTDVTAKPGKVKVKGRDSKGRKDVEAEADNDTEEKSGRLTEHVILDSGNGVTIVKIETTEEQRKATSKTTGQDDVRPTTEESDAAAKRIAKGKHRKLQQVAVKLEMEVVGDPLIFAKTIFELREAGKRLSQKYYIKKATHKIQGGYTVAIEAISDGAGKYAKRSKRAQGADLIQVGRAVKAKKGPSAEELLAGKTANNGDRLAHFFFIGADGDIIHTWAMRNPKDDNAGILSKLSQERLAIRFQQQQTFGAEIKMIETLDNRTVRIALKAQEELANRKFLVDDFRTKKALQELGAETDFLAKQEAERAATQRALDRFAASS